MREFQILQGDVLDRLSDIPSESVQCCVTSPPYWGLRDYGTAEWVGGDIACDHKQGRNGFGRADGVVDERGQRNRDGVGSMGGDCRKCGATRVDQQIGLERTPEEYTAKMVAVFREVRRVLKPDGVLFLNLGDSYNAAGRDGHGTRIGYKQGTNRASANGTDANRPTAPGLKPKDLCGIPWRVAFALQADGWWLRQDIIWAKGNGMPESVKDRCTRAHEYIFMLTKSAKYFYNYEETLEPVADGTMSRYGRGRSDDHKWANGGPGNQTIAKTFDGMKQNGHGRRYEGFNEREFAGDPREKRNMRSWWMVNTKPYPEAHFATFPPEIPQRCIAAGSREGDTVLDPFGGAGTTGMVALRMGRRAILVDLNPEYMEMARERIIQDAPMFNREVA